MEQHLKQAITITLKMSHWRKFPTIWCCCTFLFLRCFDFPIAVFNSHSVGAVSHISQWFHLDSSWDILLAPSIRTWLHQLSSILWRLISSFCWFLSISCSASCRLPFSSDPTNKPFLDSTFSSSHLIYHLLYQIFWKCTLNHLHILMSICKTSTPKLISKKPRGLTIKYW